MRRCNQNQLGGIFDITSKASQAAGSVQAAALEAIKTLTQGQKALQQGQETLTSVKATADDMDAYIQRIQNIPIEELARRFDYKSMLVTQELMSLSSFMKKSLIYLAGMATLSIYLNVLNK